MTDSLDAPIFLIGYRGTGKTTVAQLLADRLGWDWIDADDEIEQRAGKSISAIFADKGEAAFRDMESQIVAELSRRRGSVVALGGGAVLREENRAAIRRFGRVVWLTAKADAVAQRLAADENTVSRRPDLTPSGGLAEIQALLAIREPIYRACATLEVDTELRTPREIVDEIVTRL
ncbi:MAG: shikimate kinase [Planctomycetes bacterium]|nr:shikimate kinase [Planctomycetota bacterium]